MRPTAHSSGFKSHWTTRLGQASGHPAAFGVVVVYALIWIGFDRRTFDFNAIATLVVWVMTLFIQLSSRRDTLAIHAKLDLAGRRECTVRAHKARRTGARSNCSPSR